MRRVLVFQHAAHEILGTLHPMLKQAGIRIRYANFARHPELAVSMKGYEGLVILGGPMGVYEADRFAHLRHEIDCIRDAVADGKPVLGICLGAQLVAAALGGSVAPAPQKEIGWHEITLTEEGARDPVLSQLSTSERVFQWHQDELQLPPGAVRLAGSAVCANQAFRYGRNVYGFQFHLEADEAMIHRWLEIPACREQLDGPAEKIAADTDACIARQVANAERLFTKYLELFSTAKRRRTLRSRG